MIQTRRLSEFSCLSEYTRLYPVSEKNHQNENCYSGLISLSFASLFCVCASPALRKSGGSLCLYDDCPSVTMLQRCLSCSNLLGNVLSLLSETSSSERQNLQNECTECETQISLSIHPVLPGPSLCA